MPTRLGLFAASAGEQAKPVEDDENGEDDADIDGAAEEIEEGLADDTAKAAQLLEKATANAAAAAKTKKKQVHVPC